MPRLTLKLSGVGPLVVKHVEFDDPHSAHRAFVAAIEAAAREIGPVAEAAPEPAFEPEKE